MRHFYNLCLWFRDRLKFESAKYNEHKVGITCTWNTLLKMSLRRWPAELLISLKNYFTFLILIFKMSNRNCSCIIRNWRFLRKQSNSFNWWFFQILFVKKNTWNKRRILKKKKEKMDLQCYFSTTISIYDSSAN